MDLLDGSLIRAALAGLGAELGKGHAIEILVVGGAAGLLTGELPAVITTGDVDAVNFRPPEDVEAVLMAAEAVAERQQIARGWLNLDAGLYAHAVPEGWEGRQVEVGQFGRLRVHALSRLDLIATKFYAHRERDLEHLARMHVTAKELQFVLEYLKTLTSTLPAEGGKIAMAMRIAKDWVHEEGA